MAASASIAVFKAEARLFGREPGNIFWIVVAPTVLLTILGLIPAFREADPARGGLRTIDLYVPVALLMATIMACIQSMPPVLSGYRERGILRRMSTTPVRPAALLAAQMVLHGVAMLGSAVLALTVGRVAFGVALPDQIAGYALTLFLTMLSTLALGAVLAAVARNAKVATAIGSVAFILMMFTAGVWVPVQVMPDLLQRIVEFTPLGAASMALAEASGGGWPSWSHLAVVVLWSAVLAGAAVRWFRWE
ncbi:ABC transporter permease [Saccharopolyspora shandongensis]|uniref:Transport permease protein n=1 Tax=Saccharopolyspora shandongensis TaxID=418495 RepID=A0A1H2R5E9_9PSEU|nr:ABC transporter permease [Saccharopolyspora shandongensis]SDW14692.1 ABC-2 type transport system permease protein [Saccharopolyspora shandongensis]